MESVIFDGKEYTKASVLAEKFRYTSDYLGQLCRGKKVDARLVGRAWYVNLESLEQHRAARYKTQDKENPAEISEKKPIHNYLSRIDVEPIIKRKTIRILMNQKGSVSELPVKYEVDDQALIPRIQKNSLSVSLPVNPAEAERLKINKVVPGVANFAPEPLPEVYLKGSIPVVAIPESTTEDVPEDSNSKENKAITGTFDVTSKDRSPVERKVVMVRPRKIRSTESVAKTANLLPKAVVNSTKSASSAPLPPGTFKPKLVVTEKTASSPTPATLFRPLLTFIIAVFLSLGLLASSYEATVTSGGSYERGMVFTFDNFKELFR